MADTMDIELSLDDIKEMDPALLLSQFEKMRHARKDARTEVQQLRSEVERQNIRYQTLDMRLTSALQREHRKDQSLSALAQRMIGLGVLDALTLNVQTEDKE